MTMVGLLPFIDSSLKCLCTVCVAQSCVAQFVLWFVCYIGVWSHFHLVHKLQCCILPCYTLDIFWETRNPMTYLSNQCSQCSVLSKELCSCFGTVLPKCVICNCICWLSSAFFVLDENMNQNLFWIEVYDHSLCVGISVDLATYLGNMFVDGHQCCLDICLQHPFSLNVIVILLGLQYFKNLLTSIENETNFKNISRNIG